MERISPATYIDTKAYIQRFNSSRGRFARTVRNGLYRNVEPIGLPGFAREEEKVFTIALASVASPDVLRLSECSHRAVAACFVQKFSSRLEQGSISEIQGRIAENAMLGAVLVGEEADYLLVVGTNSWAVTWGLESSPGVPVVADKELLYCKTLPGLPTEIGVDGQRFLSHDMKLKLLSDIDLACPKRLWGTNCKIVHAEKSAYIMSSELKSGLNMPDAERAFLTCTWVPCYDCLNLVYVDPTAMGSRPIEVAFVYAAFRDQDDVKMMTTVREQLQSQGLGRMSGPYVGTTKEAGYGWAPALRQAVESIRTRRGPYAVAVFPEGDEMSRKTLALLKSAFSLV